METSIAELTRLLTLGDLQKASAASRMLLSRADECVPVIPALIETLDHPNRAIADRAFRILQSIGAAAAPDVCEAMMTASDQSAVVLIELAALITPLHQLSSSLVPELTRPDPQRQLASATSLVYRLLSEGSKCSDVQLLLDRCAAYCELVYRGNGVTADRLKARNALNTYRNNKNSG